MMELYNGSPRVVKQSIETLLHRFLYPYKLMDGRFYKKD